MGLEEEKVEQGRGLTQELNQELNQEMDQDQDQEVGSTPPAAPCLYWVRRSCQDTEMTEWWPPHQVRLLHLTLYLQC